MGLSDLLPRPSAYAPARATTTVPSRDGAGAARAPAAFAAAEGKRKIEMYSTEFYTTCAIGGWLSCGLTHMAVTPLDVVKCNMQIDPLKYKSIGSGFGVVLKEGGLSGLFRGWVPTLVGYGFQGTCKFGFYEYFKKRAAPWTLPRCRAYSFCDAGWAAGLGRARVRALGSSARLPRAGSRPPAPGPPTQRCAARWRRAYADAAGAETAAKYQTPIFLAASASAEVIADVALCPWEAVKVPPRPPPPRAACNASSCAA